MSQDAVGNGGPQQNLTLLDCVCIIVGIIIGAGIFETTPEIAGSVSGPAMLLVLWLLGGLLTLVGALCFGELTTAYPQEGGDYVYLSRAFGARLGFLFVWTQFWIVRPGNIGAMAFVFARYASQLRPLGPQDRTFLVYACAAVAILTLINVLGVRSGKLTQNVLTAIKIAGLLAIFATAFYSSAPIPSRTDSTIEVDYSFAMIMIFFTYGGWNDMSFVAAEVRNPNRNLFRALVLGTLTVMFVYLLVNIAFLRGLGFDGVAQSQAVAADLLELRLGTWGRKAISILICISCLGSINGMTLTGARIYYRLGTQHRLFAWLGKWNGRLGAPIRALLAQGAITLALIVGMYEQGFERMVIFATPFFWLFLFLVGVALIVLRYRDPGTERVYTVPFYPLTPIIFCSTCLFILYSSIAYAIRQHALEGHWEGYCAVLVALAGLLLSLAITSESSD